MRQRMRIISMNRVVMALAVAVLSAGLIAGTMPGLLRDPAPMTLRSTART